MLERSIALLTCSILVFPAVAYSWGQQGYQTVGRIVLRSGYETDSLKPLNI